MTGIFAIKPKDVVMNGKLYTVHGIEIKSNGERLADAVIWLNGFDYDQLSKRERRELAAIVISG